MSDTAEQGFAHPDPAQRANVGSGVVPDDLSEGEAEQSVLQTGHSEAADAARPDAAGGGTAGSATGGPTGPAAESPKTSG